MTSLSTFKAATVQFEPAMFEKERNISRLLAMAPEAALSGARLELAVGVPSKTCLASVVSAKGQWCPETQSAGPPMMLVWHGMAE